MKTSNHFKVIVAFLVGACSTSFVYEQIALEPKQIVIEIPEQKPVNEEKQVNTSGVEVVSIYDGDTFFVNLPNTAPIFGERIGIRIRGIDTPEMRDKREDIKEKARQAKMFLVEQLRTAKVVELHNLERDKYFRVVADVSVDGEDVGQMLLDHNLAQIYDGKTKKPW